MKVFILFSDFIRNDMGPHIFEKNTSNRIDHAVIITGAYPKRNYHQCKITNKYINPQIQMSHWQPCVTVITGLTTGTTGGIITSAETAQKITALLLRQKKEFEKILYISSKKMVEKNIQWQFELLNQLFAAKAEKQLKHSHGRKLGCLSS